MRTVERGGGRRGAAANTPLPVAAISSQTPCKRARELSGKELADIAQFSRRWVATWAGRVRVGCGLGRWQREVPAISNACARHP